MQLDPEHAAYLSLMEPVSKEEAQTLFGDFPEEFLIERPNPVYPDAPPITTHAHGSRNVERQYAVFDDSLFCFMPHRQCWKLVDGKWDMLDWPDVKKFREQLHMGGFQW